MSENIGEAVFRMQEKNSLRLWETALLIALCVTLLSGLIAGNAQRSLSEKLIRLHVIAASDSAEDQSTKLAVRDAVLRELAPVLKRAHTVQEAEELVTSELPMLEALSRAVSGEAHTEVLLGEEIYPRRDYEDFSLPAGRYLSLRIVLGEGAGHNWWCVVYPPLCTETVSAVAQETALLTDKDIRLITGDGEGYVLRFYLLDLWGRIFCREK